MAKTTEKKKTNTKKGPAKKSAKKKTQSKTAKKTVKQPEKQTRSIPFSETERPRRRTTEEKQAEVRKTRQEDESTKKLKDTIIGLVYIALGIFVFIAVQFKTAGEVGNQLGTFLKGALGLVGLIFPWYLVVIGLLLVTHVALHFSKKTILMTLLIVLLLCLINSGRFIDPQVNVLTDTVRFYNEGTTLEGGGFLGMFFGTLIVKLLGKPGLYIFSGCGLAIALFMILNSPVSKWLEARRVKKDEDAKIAEMERVEQARIEAYERAEERERQREERERQREGRTKIEIPPPQIYLEGIGTATKPSGGTTSIFSDYPTPVVKPLQSNAFEIAKQSPTVGKTEKSRSSISLALRQGCYLLSAGLESSLSYGKCVCKGDTAGYFRCRVIALDKCLTHCVKLAENLVRLGHGLESFHSLLQAEVLGNYSASGCCTGIQPASEFVKWVISYLHSGFLLTV